VTPDKSAADAAADLFQPIDTAPRKATDHPATLQARTPRPWSKPIIGGAVVLGVVSLTMAYSLTTHPTDRTGLDQVAGPQPTTAATALPAPPAPLPAPAGTAEALTDPPGQSRSGGGLFDLPTLKDSNLLPPAIQDALQAGGMTEGVLKTTTVGGDTIGLFAFTMPDQQAATTVALRIATTQLDVGLKADDQRAMQGIAVMGSVPGSESTAYRAVYVLYNRAVLVEVFGSNRDAVLTMFDVMLHQQVSHAPPTVRVRH
jgi:hypothetical protein